VTHLESTNGPSLTGRSQREVVDRPLSLRRRTEVSAPPFFDLPLYGEVIPTSCPN
jgi:hypothetical protein